MDRKEINQKHREYIQERTAYRKANKLCLRCTGKVEENNPKFTCEKCLKENKDRINARITARRLAGQCYNCGNDNDNKGIRNLCTTCYINWQIAAAKRRTKLRNYRRENRLCTSCGEKLSNTETYTRCEKCRFKTVDSRKKAPSYDHKQYRYKLYDQYGGAKCACCGLAGEENFDFLTMDHINNDGAEHRRQHGNAITGAKKLYLWAKKRNFPPIFQVLCFNCNCGKNRNGGVCPHKRNVNKIETGVDSCSLRAS